MLFKSFGPTLIEHQQKKVSPEKIIEDLEKTLKSVTGDSRQDILSTEEKCSYNQQFTFFSNQAAELESQKNSARTKL